ncbi:hypothetical protein EDD18DRAFT_178102 [Armillaria luteobubalina]|uniref:Secreted protein n=1 Tax=Armillaria luteobubalina TaxID=153913 RepID=A0AA39Q5U7_9AGAR|nr:hypothetical protein EDD18DRAFT_178102 [Armillaria luteobubalina]
MLSLFLEGAPFVRLRLMLVYHLMCSKPVSAEDREQRGDKVYVFRQCNARVLTRGNTRLLPTGTLFQRTPLLLASYCYVPCFTFLVCRNAPANISPILHKGDRHWSCYNSNSCVDLPTCLSAVFASTLDIHITYTLRVCMFLKPHDPLVKPVQSS